MTVRVLIPPCDMSISSIDICSRCDQVNIADAVKMDSHVGLDYIVENPDYCSKLASGKNNIDIDSWRTILFHQKTNSRLHRVFISSIKYSKYFGEEAGCGIAICPLRLQPGWTAEDNRHSPYLSGIY